MPNKIEPELKPHELVCCECTFFIVLTGNLVHAMCDECHRYLSSFVVSELKVPPKVLQAVRVPSRRAA